MLISHVFSTLGGAFRVPEDGFEGICRGQADLGVAEDQYTEHRPVRVLQFCKKIRS